MPQHAIAFDSHAFVKQLVSTGFTEEQAEIQVSLLSQVLDTQLSTKADLAHVDVHVLELKREIELIRRDVKEMEVGLKRDFRELDPKVENIRDELKRDFKELDVKLESVRAEFNIKLESVRAEFNIKLESVRAELKRDIKELDVKVESVRAELKRDIEFVRRDIRDLEQRLVIKMGGLMIVAVGALAALLRIP